MKRNVFLTLFFAVSIVTLSVVQANSQAQKKPQKSETQLRNDLNKVKGQRSTIARELNKTKKAVRVVKGDLNQIDGRLGQLENDLEVTAGRLHKGVSEQSRLKKELELANKKLAATKEKLKKRLKWMYMHGDTAAISVLADSRSFGDFASRNYTIKRIAASDKRLFQDYKDLCALITTKKQRQDRLVVEVRELKSKQEVQQADLKETRGDKAYLLGQLRDKQKDLERLIRQLDAEEDSITAQINAYNNSAGKPNLSPFKGKFSKPVSARITSGFGVRFHPILKRNRLHAGIDFGAKSGTPIKAAADGIVIASRYTKGYGNMVMIDHGGDITTLYGHCSRVYVKSGQRVSRGQNIAAVGSTGLSTGPHLHFEVRVKGKPVNPAGWL